MKEDSSSKIENSEIGDSEIREFSVIHDSSIGDNCRIYENTSIKKSEISDYIDINSGCYIENANIKENVQIGPNVSIVGVSHRIDESGMEFRKDRFEEITINNGAFIGAGSVILPGVKIGKNAVIAANSTVTKDVSDNQVWKGTPKHEVTDIK